ncbi:MAG: hypothetical protein Q9205_002979 [Flavoplaca limonia]
MSDPGEDYPMLAAYQRKHEAKAEAEAEATAIAARKLLRGPSNSSCMDDSNEHRRPIMLRNVQLICVNALPGVDGWTIVCELVVGLGFEPFSVLTLVNDELADKRSPYLAMMLTPDLDRKAPARMYVEILSNHLHDMAWQGRLRFVVTDFPTDQDQATIFEEDCTLIEAFVLVEGKKLGKTPQPAGEESSAALRSVFEKFATVGRAFKINADQDPNELREDISKLVKALK